MTKPPFQTVIGITRALAALVLLIGAAIAIWASTGRLGAWKILDEAIAGIVKGLKDWIGVTVDPDKPEATPSAREAAAKNLENNIADLTS